MSVGDVQGNYSYDLRFLGLFDSNQLWNPEQQENLSAAEKEEIIQKKAQQNVLRIFHKLLDLKNQAEAERDKKPDEFQIHDFNRNPNEIDIPQDAPLFKIPRQRRAPDREETMTKWEKFAKEKGIRKKKRGRMVFDEIKQDWVPRWGAYSVKKNEKKANYIMEVKQGDDPYEDPFVKQGLKKKLEKEQHKMNELKNRLEKKGYNAKEVLNQSDARREQKKKLKTKVSKTIGVAQNSTASMGQFDKKAHREEKPQKVQKRKLLPQFKDINQEKKRDLDIFDMVKNYQGAKKIKKD